MSALSRMAGEETFGETNAHFSSRQEINKVPKTTTGWKEKLLKWHEGDFLKGGLYQSIAVLCWSHSRWSLNRWKWKKNPCAVLKYKVNKTDVMAQYVQTKKQQRHNNKAHCGSHCLRPLIVQHLTCLRSLSLKWHLHNYTFHLMQQWFQHDPQLLFHHSIVCFALTVLSSTLF